jgi:vitamin B12 transporter
MLHVRISRRYLRPLLPTAVGACLTLPAFTAIAQTQTLPDVAIVGARTPTALDRLVGDVVVIDAERIRNSSADSIEDLLRREGGMQLSRNGGPGQSAAILMRGTGASSTLVLIDGVRVGSATLGQTDLATIGLAGVERIEILRGPGSSLYGADAVGGVINIVTRRGGGPTRIAANALVGELQSSNANVSAAGSVGRFDYAATLAREASGGVTAVRPNDLFGSFNPDRDGYMRSTVQLRGGVQLAQDHRLDAMVREEHLNSRYDSADFPPPNFTPDPTPDFRNHDVNRVLALDYRGTLSATWTMGAKLSGQSDDLDSGGTTMSSFRTRRGQATWQAEWRPNAGQQLLVALERLDEEVEGTSFLQTLRRHTDSAVVGYTGAFGPVKMQADVRHDRNSVFGSVTTGKLGVGVEVQRGLTLRAVAGTAFRAPTFNDLYFPGFGVPTIGPERSKSVELGVQWHGQSTEASATIYRNWVRDLIVFEPDRSFCPPDPAYDFGCARNVARARLQGATLSAGQRFGAFDLRARVDFLDAVDEATGNRLPRRAAHQESLDLGWTHGPWWASAALVGVGARPDAGAQLGAYATVDFQVRYRFAPHWQAEARLTNAFDRDYQPARDYNVPGRQAWLGVRYDSTGL